MDCYKGPEHILTPSLGCALNIVQLTTNALTSYNVEINATSTDTIQGNIVNQPFAQTVSEPTKMFNNPAERLTVDSFCINHKSSSDILSC